MARYRGLVQACVCRKLHPYYLERGRYARNISEARKVPRPLEEVTSAAGACHPTPQIAATGDRANICWTARNLYYALHLARYWINFAHTAKYKSKPHAIAVTTNQIAIFPNLGTRP